MTLIGTLVVSLAVEFVLTVHVVVGLIFVMLVALHLAQRRRTAGRLLRRFWKPIRVLQKPGRLAAADALLLVLTAAMLSSGIADLTLGHPTKIRWHALTGIALAVMLTAHTLRRRLRLVVSAIA